MSLNIKCTHILDPDGHNPALLLKGDWLIVEITDGYHTGYGESSHSQNNDLCEKNILFLFNTYVKDLELSCNSIEKLSKGPFAKAKTFVEATAISGINQALYDLYAKRESTSVWNLFADKDECQLKIPVYATINRALTSRTLENYEEIVKNERPQN